MTDAKRAENVCHACMSRKKACDKALPACGFCASRRLLCRYDTSAPQRRDWRKYNPGRHFVALQSPSPPNAFTQAKAPRQLPSLELHQDHPFHHHFAFYTAPLSLDESLNQLGQRVTELTQLAYDNIINRYFEVSRRWLPIISPDSFRREASWYRNEERTPPADFTVLILAMLLIILPSLDPTSRPSRATQELLYKTTKSAFSQAQASICTSLRLVQAAVLIALREYTCIRPEAAYISIMNCVGLARVLGIEIRSRRTTRDAQMTSESISGNMEGEKVFWAIVMLERYD